MPFEFQKLDIPDVLLLKPKVFNDDRGFFKEVYKLILILFEVTKDFPSSLEAEALECAIALRDIYKM